MELRSPLTAHPSRLTPPLRASRHRLHRVVTKVASAGDFETDDEKETEVPSPSDEASRKKLEVVTGLLREGYGVGAILTAAAFRSAAFAGDLIKNFTQSSKTVQRQKTLKRVRNQNPGVATQKLSQSLKPSQIKWNSRKESDEYLLKAMHGEDEVSQNEEFLDDVSGNENQSAVPNDEPEMTTDSNLSFGDSPFLSEKQSEDGDLDVRDQSEDRGEMDFKELLGILPDEQLSSRHISEESLKPSNFVEATDESIFGSDILEQLQPEEDNQARDEDAQVPVLSEFVDTVQEETSVEDLPVGDADLLEDLIEEGPVEASETQPPPEPESAMSSVGNADTRLENNVERFQNPQEVPAESSEDSSVVMNRAMEILDEIASFELETGESVDDDAEEEKEAVAVPAPQTVEMSKSESEAEIKRQMRIESEKRLKTMRVGNEPKYQQRESPVKVERPTPQSRERAAGSPMSPPTQRLKGLDYIKSYAKENHEHMSGEPSKDSSGSFFTPPPILQDPKKSQVPQASSSPSRGYTQWNEIDRLKRVREIGTVLWLGRGGNGGNGGNGGGGGGGGGRSGDNSDDKGWWIQVGVSMMTMTALVFALLVAVSNQLEKQQKRKRAQEQLN